MQRNIVPQIKKDLEKKIILLSGPRQIGKTTLSKELYSHFEYLNYDNTELRKIIMNRSWPRDCELVIFDELHKKAKWKSWIKGIYDVEGVHPKILVTGSARLDVFKKGGDSLAGRHLQFRLHPFSVAELKGQMPSAEVLERLLAFGGFPEPFLEASEVFAKRWRISHIDRILKQDVLELEPIRQIKLMEILVDLLAERVGSTINYSSLARDLEISPHTVKKWIAILESMYVIFIVTPYSKKISRALLKEPKIYFFDTGRIKNDPGIRLENTIALALLKDLNLREDFKGERCALHYLRDKEKREVDFLTLVDGKIEQLIEVKWSDENLSKNLQYFAEKIAPKAAIQLVHQLKNKRQIGKIKIQNCLPYLESLESATL